MPNRADYNSFADYYDFAMGDRAESAFAIEQLISIYHKSATSLLELGCGSGSLLRILSRKYNCLGVDLSPGMIKAAKRKVPNVPLRVADISKFSTPSRFDVAVCAFDTINHIIQFESWKKVFSVAQKHLNPGGLFIFDINTERKLSRYAEEPAFAEFEGDTTSTFEVVKTSKSRFSINVQVFAPSAKGRYIRKSMIVREATYPTAKIVSALKHHFKKVTVLDPERPKPSQASEELYFVCRAPLPFKKQRS